jgi:hypothetical protein
MGIQQEDLGELAAARVHGEQKVGAVGPPAEAADRFAEEGDLVAGAAGLIDPVDLADVTEPGGHVKPGAILVPGAEPRGTNVLVPVQVAYHRGGDVRDVLHDEIAVVGLGPDDLGLDTRHRQQQGERETQDH